MEGGLDVLCGMKNGEDEVDVVVDVDVDLDVDVWNLQSLFDNLVI